MDDSNDYIENLPNTFFVTILKMQIQSTYKKYEQIWGVRRVTVIIDRLKDKEDFHNFEVIWLLIGSLGTLYPIYHKIFGKSLSKCCEK